MVNNDEQFLVEIQPNWLYSYLNCKREAWLISHGVEPYQNFDLLELGRLIHEEAYSRYKHELINAPGMKIDIVTYMENKLLIGEIKSSSKKLKQAKLQLLYYLYILKNQGIKAEGELLIPKEKKRMKVNLDEQSEIELKRLLEDLKRTIELEKPPKAEYKTLCKSCAYGEFCWGG
jgi:CRISPR-associated exonuclease Cas4